MTKRQVTKLFAVVALAGGCELADADKPAKALVAPKKPSVSAVAPRTLPSGRPACGNVASRAPRSADCERRGKAVP